MQLSPLVLQTAGSLVAILALAGLSWWLKLGGNPLLDDEDAVRRAAGEVADGFVPVACAISQSRTAALARDSLGRIMLIKRHGNRFAGRLLAAGARAQFAKGNGGTIVIVDCGERRFGTVVLELRDPETWAAAINRLRETHNA